MWIWREIITRANAFNAIILAHIYLVIFLSSISACFLNLETIEDTKQVVLRLATSFPILHFPRMSFAVGLKELQPDIRLQQSGQDDFPFTVSELQVLCDSGLKEVKDDILLLSYLDTFGIGTEVCELIIVNGTISFQRKTKDGCLIFNIPDKSRFQMLDQATNALNHAIKIIESTEVVSAMYSAILTRYNTISKPFNDYDEGIRCLRLYTPAFFIIRLFTNNLKRKNFECMFCPYSVMEACYAQNAFLRSEVENSNDVMNHVMNDVFM